jgi:hypothetical protein
MKKLIYLAFIFLLFNPAFIFGAEEFLEAPVIPQGTVIKKSDARLELKTELSHKEVLSFYKEALRGFENIKFREWKDATYIEDDGTRPWHSITISKGDQKETYIIIVKDNWTWIIGTLVLRYIGVFVVLMVLFLGMLVSGKIISGSVKKAAAKKQQEQEKEK